MVFPPEGSSLGRYQVLDLLGRGGMATVYRAHDPELKRDVAVKVLPSHDTDDPTFAQRFRQEAQAVARLNHPNIVQIYDFGEDQGLIYIVMEYVTGGTLVDSLRHRHHIAEVVDMIAPLAEALDLRPQSGHPPPGHQAG